MTHAKTRLNDTTERQLVDTTVNYCLEHLRRELRTLTGCLESLQGVRDALGVNDGEKLLAAIEAQDQTEKMLAELRADRSRLVNRLAVALDMPADRATVGLLQRRLDPGGRKLELQAARRQVRNLAKSVERLCRGNASLIAHRMDLTRRLLYALGAGNNGAYHKTGEIEASAAAATIERNC